MSVFNNDCPWKQYGWSQHTQSRYYQEGPIMGWGQRCSVSPTPHAMHTYPREVDYNLFMLFPPQDCLYFLVRKLKQKLKIKQLQKVIFQMVRCPGGLNKDTQEKGGVAMDGVSGRTWKWERIRVQGEHRVEDSHSLFGRQYLVRANAIWVVVTSQVVLERQEGLCVRWTLD